jgi:N-acetylmuramoyl-L-alanine amidase
VLPWSRHRPRSDDWTTVAATTCRARSTTSGPTGTRLTITGERDGFYRVRLAANRTAWVPVDDVRLLPEGSPPPAASSTPRASSPRPQWIDLRIPTPERLPFQVTVEERTLHIDVFGATSRANFFQHGAVDPLLTHAEWSRWPTACSASACSSTAPVWGYHTFFDAAGAIVLRIRRPPAIDPAAPLRGCYRRRRSRPRRRRPRDTRADRTDGSRREPGNLAAPARCSAGRRPRHHDARDGRHRAARRPAAHRRRLGVHVLVSVHNNAFPDGVNPWLNNGTSTYYFQPQSASWRGSCSSSCSTNSACATSATAAPTSHSCARPGCRPC